MGNHGTAGRRRHTQRMRGPRYGVSSAYARQRRFVGRDFLHWNRLPTRVLSEISPVQRVFPADRAYDIFEGDSGEGQQLAIREPDTGHTKCQVLTAKCSLSLPAPRDFWAVMLRASWRNREPGCGCWCGLPATFATLTT